MSKSTPLNTSNSEPTADFRHKETEKPPIPKSEKRIVPTELIETIREQSKQACERWDVPFIYVLLAYLHTNGAGPSKHKYNNVLNMQASGSEVRVMEGDKRTWKASYESVYECYERFAWRHSVTQPDSFSAYIAGKESLEDMLKAHARYDLLETLNQYDLSTIIKEA